MTLSAPIPIIEGSQTEFSKVWIRGSTATSTLPNLRFYKADGRIVHPIAAALNITIVHTAADTLYNRIQAAITAADATKTAAWVAKWMAKNKIVGIVTDAITGDTLLVNRAETSGMTAQNEEPVARTAADFYAQETYAVGTRFTHGIAPGDRSGLNGATVNINGEVETSQAWKTGPIATGTVTSTNDYLQGSCAGMASVVIETTTAASGPNVRVDTYENGTWTQAQFAYRSASSAGWTTAVSYTGFVATVKLIVTLPPGATAYRLVMTGGGAGPHTIVGTPSAIPFSPPSTLVGGSIDLYGKLAHDTAVGSIVFPMGADARSADGTAVSSGDATRLLATLLGKLVAMPYAVPGQTWQYAGPAGGISDTADDVVASAGGSGVRNYVTAVQIVNMSTTATEVVLKDGSTVIWRCEFDADGGAAGISINFPTPLRGTANTALNVACLTTSSKVYVNAQGFTAAE